MNDRGWIADAACRSIGGDVWFPEPGQSALAARAVRICQECPVREQCLDDALRMEGATWWQHRHGVWGGLSPRERHARAKELAAGTLVTERTG